MQILNLAAPLTPLDDIHVGNHWVSLTKVYGLLWLVGKLYNKTIKSVCSPLCICRILSLLWYMVHSFLMNHLLINCMNLFSRIFYLVRLAKVVASLNSLCNPFIYLQCSTEFRAIVRKCLRRLRTPSPSPSSTSTSTPTSTWRSFRMGKSVVCTLLVVVTVVAVILWWWWSGKIM